VSFLLGTQISLKSTDKRGCEEKSFCEGPADIVRPLAHFHVLIGAWFPKGEAGHLIRAGGGEFRRQLLKIHKWEVEGDA